MTAMQDLKIHIQNMVDNGGDMDLLCVLGLIDSEFLEQEKKQITLGWIDGKETYGYGFDVFTDAEFYYHKKYIESEM